MEHAGAKRHSRAPAQPSEPRGASTIGTQPRSPAFPCACAAASGGSVQILDILVAAGADLHAVDGKGWGAAHYAAQFGREAFLARLIAAGVDIARPNAHRATPLVSARRAAFLTRPSHLPHRLCCAAGPFPSPHSTPTRTHPPTLTLLPPRIHIFFLIVILLRNILAPAPAALGGRRREVRGGAKAGPLHAAHPAWGLGRSDRPAAGGGGASGCRRLRGRDPAVSVIWRQPSCFSLAPWAQLSVLGSLVKAAAAGRVLALAAKRWQRAPCLQLAQHASLAVQHVRLGCRPEGPLHESLLLHACRHYAACFGTAGAVERLVAGGAALEGARVGGERPLHYAAQYCNLAAVEALLAEGAAVNAVIPSTGRRPLHLARGRESREIALALLAAGAAPNLKDGSGRSAVKAAAGQDAALLEELRAAAEERRRCAVCEGREGLRQCSRCLSVHYCGAEHQRQHWPEHKARCKHV